MSGTNIQENGDVTAVTASDGRMTLSLPIRLKRPSGRRLMTLPSGERRPARVWDTVPTPLQVAIAPRAPLAPLARIWGCPQSMRKLASRDGVDSSCLSRMVNLTVLSPEIVARILDHDLPGHVVLFDLVVDPPAEWAD